MRYRYWDACVFLGWLKEEEDKLNECTAGIRHAEQGEVMIGTPPLTIGRPNLPQGLF